MKILATPSNPNGPPRDGSIAYEIVALATTSALPLYLPLLCEAADVIVPKIFDAVINFRAGNNKAVDKALDVIAEQNRQMADERRRADEFVREVHRGQMQDKAWLQNQVEKLSDFNKVPLEELPAPVGRSCRVMQIATGEATGYQQYRACVVPIAIRRKSRDKRPLRH